MLFFSCLLRNGFLERLCRTKSEACVLQQYRVRRKEFFAPEYGARRHVFEKVKGKAFQTRITQYLIRNAPWRVGDGNEPFARDDVGRFSFIEYHFLELGPYGRFYKEFPSDDERPLASPKAEESDEAPDHEA